MHRHRLVSPSCDVERLARRIDHRGRTPRPREVVHMITGQKGDVSPIQECQIRNHELDRAIARQHHQRVGVQVQQICSVCNAIRQLRISHLVMAIDQRHRRATRGVRPQNAVHESIRREHVQMVGVPTVEQQVHKKADGALPSAGHRSSGCEVTNSFGEVGMLRRLASGHGSDETECTTGDRTRARAAPRVRARVRLRFEHVAVHRTALRAASSRSSRSTMSATVGRIRRRSTRTGTRRSTGTQPT